MVDRARIAMVVFMTMAVYKVVISLARGEFSLALWAGFAGYWCWQAEFAQIKREVR